MSEKFSEFVQVDVIGSVAQVTFGRGDGLNSLSIGAMTQLKNVANFFREETKVSAIVLTSDGAFSAGADLRDPDRETLMNGSLIEKRNAVRLGTDLCQAWHDLDQITIAAIDTYCIGGGLALAVALDHRIASPSAMFQLPEGKLGMNLTWRTNPRLVSLVGSSRAKLLAGLGRKIDANTALNWGLIDEISSEVKSLEAALELARDYAELPPIPLRMTKQAINAAAQPLAFTSSFMDGDQFLLTAMSDDQGEAIASFLDKRPAKYSGN